MESEPLPPTAPEPFAPQPAAPRRTGLGRLRGGVATLAFAGLLVIGGVAAVSAASPDPSASPTPAATDTPSDGTAPSATDRAARGHSKGDCPADGSGNGGTDDDGGQTPAPSSDPATDSDA
jgi:hypothetical protein